MEFKNMSEVNAPGSDGTRSNSVDIRAKAGLRSQRTIAPRCFLLTISLLFGGIFPLPSIQATEPAGSPPVPQEDKKSGDSGKSEKSNPDGRANPPANGQVDSSSEKNGFMVRVPMPITSDVANRVIASIDRVLEKTTGFGGERPILILEFDNRNGTNGVGSTFADCLKIAQHLTSSSVSRIRTIAYLPGVPPGSSDLFDEGEPQAEFVGHVVLVALSCEEIVMHKQAAIGRAGMELDAIDELLATAYRSVTSKRSKLPVPVALSMLDKSLTLHRAELRDGGVKYVDEKEFDELDAAGKVVSSQTIADVGNFGFFTSQELQSYRLITHRVETRRELADRFNLPRTALEGDPSLGKEWNAIRIQVNGVVNDRLVTWIENALNTRVSRDEVNLIIVEIESAGGESPAVLRLANLLADFDETKVRTVAFVPDRAKGVSSIIAMGCDHIVMTEQAELGGESRPPVRPDRLGAIKESVKELAKKQDRSWSLIYGLIDPALEVKRFKHRQTGRVRMLSEEEVAEFKDADEWQELQVVDLGEGIDGGTAETYNLIRNVVEDFEELKSFYQLTEEPTILEPTLADKWVEKLAHQLASPRVAWLVLFFGIFFLSMEMSNPGLGIPGFLSALCWLLFFWSQYFDGNASVLEIMLFVVGAIFLIIELFVLPGFGVFGIGGGLMITVSIILAVQTFVLPRNSEEVAQMTTSLLTFLGACSGFFVALFVFRKYMSQIPILKRLSLASDMNETDLANQKMKESLVEYGFLVGKNGVAQTRLMPSGKALIANELYNVISDGRMIEKGTDVIVKNVSGNKIEVGIRS